MKHPLTAITLIAAGAATGALATGSPTATSVEALTTGFDSAQVIRVKDEIKEVEKAAEKAAKDAEKAAEKAEKQAEKASDKAADKAEKRADKAADRAEKQADKSLDKAEKELDKAEDRAEKAAEKSADKAEKRAEKLDDKVEKATEKAAKHAEKRAEQEAKAAEKAEKSLDKDLKKVEKELEKDLEKALKETDDAARERHMAMFKADIERSAEEREKLVQALMDAKAPQDRNMVEVIERTSLQLMTEPVTIENADVAEIITYRNCPPGLMNKTPACVPPGLAKQGVTYEEWVSYDSDRLEDLLEERRTAFVAVDSDASASTGDVAVATDAEIDLLLSSDRIATIYDLDPAPEGQKYALIDGLPVLLTDADYLALIEVNELAHTVELKDTTYVSPAAALTQAELVQTYALPELADGYNYAVVNGEVLMVEDSAYEMLQLLRIARAAL
ncbi:hypothetical protein [Roseovarius nubinhibens]|uniref:Uncharacterized protein n=1 Tax=Roseovarius nubinhibens (strain ATCC BAA-591 / DSM 15170 / ISM) TaxID=89187 RepID=A3SR61_ROSNI|nr:hypothetical protein [Roseovarius nubinhibens]EAP75084.1 hypothetical protein ISM_10870 [Roseovarius nubinhibens ISM]